MFYVRCEEIEGNLLVGNMQIDCRGEKLKCAHEHFAATLAKPRNIYKAMVQETLKWAHAQKYKSVIFQAGYANQITQHGYRINEDNGRELNYKIQSTGTPRKICHPTGGV